MLALMYDTVLVQQLLLLLLLVYNTVSIHSNSRNCDKIIVFNNKINIKKNKYKKPKEYNNNN